MTANEIRKMTTEDIVKKIEEKKEELFNLRFKQSTGTLEKPARLHELRKDVARLKTILKEREVKEEL